MRASVRTIGAWSGSLALALGCGGKTDSERTAGRTTHALSDGCSSAAASEGFVSEPIEYEAGTFWADFDATPSENDVDAVVGFSDGPPDSFSDLSVALRFNPDGFIDARDGDTYHAFTAARPYSGGLTYHFHVEIDIDAHVYRATVREPDGTTSYVASDFAFRSTQAAALQITHRVAEVDSPSGSLTVCNYQRPFGDDCVRTDAGTGWNNRQFWPDNGTAAFSALAKPTEANEDAVIGISPGSASRFGDLAATVRFNASGFVDARNGGSYSAATSLPYTAGQMFRFNMALDVPRHSYSARVDEGAIAQNYAFRTEQAGATELENVGVFVDSASGGVILCNPALTSVDRAIYSVPSQSGGLAVGPNGSVYEMGNGELQVRDAATGAVVRSVALRGAGSCDSAGNLYVVGVFTGTYDPGTGPLTSAGANDVFVAKYGPDLAPIWAQRLGTAQDDDVSSFRVGGGHEVLIGNTLGTVVLDDDGNVASMTTTGATAVATNARGEVALVGSPSSGGVWVEKRDATGATLWRNTYPVSEVRAVALSDTGEVAFSGRFSGTVNFGGNDLVFHGGGEAPSSTGYVVKLSADGAHVWSLSNDNHYLLTTLATDPGGNVIFAATTGSQVYEASIAKYGAADGKQLWRQAESERGQTTGIAVDPTTGAVYWKLSHDDYGQGTSEVFLKKLAP
jgi:hypothetical protein